jgi:putative glycerol-1-phosphate prenyltransferase
VEGWRQRLRGWRHVTKLDPDRPLEDRRLEAVLASGTDAVVLGGTLGITAEKVRSLLARVAGRGLPVAIEISCPDSLVLGADLYLVPVVLNAGDPYWTVGAHQQAIKQLGGWPAAAWQLVVPEGYVVLNPDSAVAELTRALCPLAAADVVAYASCAAGLFGMPVVYLESSGRYGDPSVVAEVASALDGGARVVYGGGIDRPERAAAMAAVADTVVVGNFVYEGDPVMLADLVDAVRLTPPPRGAEG